MTNQEAISKLSSTFPVDSEVLKIALAKSYLKKFNLPSSDKDVDSLVKTWGEDALGNPSKEIDEFFRQKAKEMSLKGNEVMQNIQNLIAQNAAIVATAGSTYAAPAAVPMKLQIKTQVQQAKTTLGSLIMDYSKLGLEAPDSIKTLSTTLAALSF